MARKEQKDVLEDFMKKHGNTYDYSLVEYVSATDKIKIICRRHGIFLITPNSHLNGSGCYRCGREKVENSRRRSNESFINQAKLTHGELYDYSKTEYKDYKSKITIICPRHGEFTQKAVKHLSGNKCKKCVNESYYIDFISICKEKFPDYGYDKVIYKGLYEPVIITCKLHGDFIQKPVALIHKLRGCKKCLVKTTSKPEKLWLDSFNLPLNNRNVYVNFGKKTFCVDGIDNTNKIIYEFYGDFFHGNPEIFNSDDMNPLLKETYGSLYKKTKEKEEIIKQNGYTLITIWENEFKKKNKK